MYEQKEIVLIPFPYSNLSAVKQRPAVIISNKNVNKTENRICCLITSNPSKEGMAIEDNCFSDGRLPFQSWVKPHRLLTIHKGIIRKKLGAINDNFHDDIIKRINEHLKRI